MIKNNENTIRIGYVVSIDDPFNGKRIKVRIINDDDGINNNDLPFAFPLMPKMIHITPKIGEAVLIISSKTGISEGQRFYIGPIIHQPQFMPYDDYNRGATSLLSGGPEGYVLPALTRQPEAIGALCNNEDISLIGRCDTDIILGEKELNIRCGVRLTESGDKTKITFNKTNPTYLKLKYHENQLNDRSKSTATIVSERINLIGTNSKQYFDVSNNKELITDDVMNKIIEEAHVLPYGDTLVEFLKIFMKAFMSHTHAYSGLPPIPNADYIAMESYNLNDILSETVRIN